MWHSTGSGTDTDTDLGLMCKLQYQDQTAALRFGYIFYIQRWSSATNLYSTEVLALSVEPLKERKQVNFQMKMKYSCTVEQMEQMST